MSVHVYRCRECYERTEISLPINNTVPSFVKCENCKSESTFKVFTPPYIGKGVKSRVYYQWKGDPERCPEELKDTLKNQRELPGNITAFHKEGEPVLGTGDKFKR